MDTGQNVQLNVEEVFRSELGNVTTLLQLMEEKVVLVMTQNLALATINIVQVRSGFHSR